MVKVDVRGFSCPVPVVRTKKAMEQNPKEILTVLTETAVSKENVSRAATSQGWQVMSVDSEGTGYRITIAKD